MQSKPSKASKLTTNSFERQNRAIVNLQQLSDYPWQHPYQDTSIPEPVAEEKLNTNTHESAQLPLNPKQKHYETPIRSKLKSIPNDKPRPNTIHNTTHHPDQSITVSKNRKIQPLTALNFYEDPRRSYNTFDDRTRLNQEIELYASRIRQQGKFFNSIELTRKQPQNLSFKSSVARRSLFYKEFKSFLYESFKVDGKPVEIKRDKYSIESHGLPKKKSIYSFKERQGDFFAFNKTDVLIKRVGRYEMEENEEKEKGNGTSRVYGDEISLINRSLQMKNSGRRRMKGKLILGRPPTTVLCEEE